MDDQNKTEAEKVRDASLAASEKRIKDAEAAADARRQRTDATSKTLDLDRDLAERDRDLEDQRGTGRHVTNPRAPEAVARQHEAVDQAKAKRDEENRPGHEKNMERIEAEAHEAHARTQHADDHRANHVPTGKQENRNTPRVLPDGGKVWDK